MAAAGLGAWTAIPVAQAMKRPAYGGSLRLSLPVATRDLDPHDPYSLSAALLGNTLFETLYLRDRAERVYPSLAAALPEKGRQGTLIQLRPGLSTAAGRPLDARYIVRSLTRAQATCRPLAELGTFTAHKADRVQCSNPDPSRVALLLSSLRAAIFDGGFDSCGPFQIEADNRALRLARNPRAARGGAYLDEVSIRSATVRESLRDFEAGSSAVGFLGSGLYHSRSDARRFALSPIGWVAILAGRQLDTFGAPGVMHATLRGVPSIGLEALGLTEVQSGPRRTWSGPPIQLGVDEAEPWLLSIAREVADSLSASNHEVTVQPRPRDELQRQRATGSYEAMIAFVRSDAPLGSEIRDLFRLDGSTAPRTRAPTTVHEAARRLRLGILGSLVPRGAMAAHVRHFVEGGRLHLENTTLDA